MGKSVQIIIYFFALYVPNLVFAAPPHAEVITPSSECAGQQLNGISKTECDALIAFYQQTEGSTWTKSTNWLTSTPACTWHGVKCKSGRVISLQLNSNNLEGNIPTAIGSLPHLDYLSLSNNKLTGQLPAEFSNLTQLRQLHLTNNQFNGPFPEQVLSLSKLEQLSLTKNQFSGSIPNTVGTLTNLKRLLIAQNQFTGTIPDTVGSLLKLQYLDVSTNQLSGALPDLSGLEELLSFSATKNQLSGGIPNWLPTLTKLRTVNISNNNLSGALPSDWSKASSLQSLLLNNNQLSDSLSESIWTLPNLKVLNLTNNQFEGILSGLIGSATALQQLYLGNNKINGAIPSTIGNLTGLTHLQLHNNRFSCAIPSTLTNMTGLKQLYLRQNRLFSREESVSQFITAFRSLELTQQKLDEDTDGVLSVLEDSNGNCIYEDDDADIDGTPNFLDTDSDNDGVYDAFDNCPLHLNADQADSDSDLRGDVCDSEAPGNTLIDTDSDGIVDTHDNCPFSPNFNQLDTDGDGAGDVCDIDDDNDTVVDSEDNCPFVANLNQQDNDTDGIGNVCDNTPGLPQGENPPGSEPPPTDKIEDDIKIDLPVGDRKPPGSDSDGDGIDDELDNCPGDFNIQQDDGDRDGFGDGCDNDRDNDSILDGKDNCPNLANKNQLDTDKDSIGNACDEDDDGDQVSDAQELLDGTDPLDRGSVFRPLTSPVCAEWNSFFDGMENVLEQVNLSSRPLLTETVLYSMQGKALHTTRLNLAAHMQNDILVHDIPERELNSYGRICSMHNGNPGELDGRIVYYKKSPADASRTEFAFAVPFSNGTTGTQFVPFNTFQPSLAASDVDNGVANWIQLSNLSAQTERGTLLFYDMFGKTIGTQDIVLRAGERRDISAHQFGSYLIGLVEWIPQNRAAFFQLRNARYYYSGTGFSSDAIQTAYQLEGSAGNGRTVAVPLDTTIGSAILEVANVLDKKIEASITLYNRTGNELMHTVISLGPKESYHLITDAILKQQHGSALVRSSARGGLLATAMQYERAADSSILSIYGISARESTGASLEGSYNSFLGQDCIMQLVNTSASMQRVAMSIRKSDATPLPIDNGATVKVLELPAHGSYVESICKYDSPDSYGTVTFQLETNNSVVGSIIRIGKDASYRFETPLR